MHIIYSYTRNKTFLQERVQEDASIQNILFKILFYYEMIII